MTEIIDSIAIESSIKRVPKSRQGRVLMFMRNQIINEMKAEVKDRKFHVPTDKVARVAALNNEIKKRIVREDRKTKKQSQLTLDIQVDKIQTFQIRYVKPGQRRVRVSNVDATSKKAAGKIIKQMFGRKSLIKSITKY
jgi:hypothetical protein